MGHVTPETPRDVPTLGEVTTIADVPIMATTNSDGKFVLSGLPGNAGVALLVEGFHILPETLYTCPNAKHPRVLEATNGTIRTGALQIEARPASSITLHVTDDDTKQPIAGADVRVLSGRQDLHLKTNASGVAVVGSIDPAETAFAMGSYVVRGFVRTSIRVDPAMFGNDPVPIAIRKGVWVQGRIFNSVTNQGVAKVSADLTPISLTHQTLVPGVHRATSGVTGHFQILLPEGEWKLAGRVGTQGFVPYVSNESISAAVNPIQPPSEVQIPLLPTRRLKVTVNFPDGSPVVGAEVRTVTHAKQNGNGVSYRNFESKTNSTGRFEILGVYDNVTDDDVEDWYETPIRIRTADSKFAAVVGTSAPTKGRDSLLEVTLQPTATIKGRVVDAVTGAPIVDVTVSPSLELRRVRGEFNTYQPDKISEYAEVRTDKDGKFELKGLFPGAKYNVGGIKQGYESGGSQPIELSSGETATIETIRLESLMLPKTLKLQPFEIGNLKPGTVGEACEGLLRQYETDRAEFEKGRTQGDRRYLCRISRVRWSDVCGERGSF